MCSLCYQEWSDKHHRYLPCYLHQHHTEKNIRMTPTTGLVNTRRTEYHTQRRQRQGVDTCAFLERVLCHTLSDVVFSMSSLSAHQHARETSSFKMRYLLTMVRVILRRMLIRISPRGGRRFIRIWWPLVGNRRGCDDARGDVRERDGNSSSFSDVVDKNACYVTELASTWQHAARVWVLTGTFSWIRFVRMWRTLSC